MSESNTEYPQRGKDCLSNEEEERRTPCDGEKSRGRIDCGIALKGYNLEASETREHVWESLC